MSRRRDPLGQARRGLYFARRDIGDYQVLRRGPLVYARRRLRRSLTRNLFALLCDALR